MGLYTSGDRIKSKEVFIVVKGYMGFPLSYKDKDMYVGGRNLLINKFHIDKSGEVNYMASGFSLPLCCGDVIICDYYGDNWIKFVDGGELKVYGVINSFSDGLGEIYSTRHWIMTGEIKEITKSYEREQKINSIIGNGE